MTNTNQEEEELNFLACEAREQPHVLLESKLQQFAPSIRVLLQPLAGTG